LISLWWILLVLLQIDDLIDFVAESLIFNLIFLLDFDLPLDLLLLTKVKKIAYKIELV
jgi:hypothetical protein